MSDFVSNYSWYSLMVRDVGPYNVEFWWRANDQTIHYSAVHTTINANGSDGHFTTDVPAYSDWIKIATYNIPTTQYVSFTLDGWDTFTVHILRSVPDPPGQPTLSNVQIHSADVSWLPPGYVGSCPITGYQVGYGTNPSGPTTTVSVINSPYPAIGLAMGTVYYFWVRAQNGLGYGAWSPVNSVRTLTGAYVNVGGVWKAAIPYVNVAGVWKQAEPSVTHF